MLGGRVLILVWQEVGFFAVGMRGKWGAWGKDEEHSVPCMAQRPLPEIVRRLS